MGFMIMTKIWLVNKQRVYMDYIVMGGVIFAMFWCIEILPKYLIYWKKNVKLQTQFELLKNFDNIW